MHAVRAKRVCQTAPNANLFAKVNSQDTICIYNTSDRSKQKLLVDVDREISFFLSSEMTSDFFGYLMLIKIKYGRYTNHHIRAHESDSEVSVRQLGKIIQRNFFCSIRSQHSQSRLEML